MKINWESKGIDISKQRGGKMTCPKCSESRKNKKDLCLSVDIEKGLFKCHNCDFKGSVAELAPKKQYSKPVHRLEKLGTKAIAWFENERKISNNTLLRFGITEHKEIIEEKEKTWICFNFFRDEKLVNIKFRDGAKKFKLSYDAELIFYNLDAIKDSKSCVIVEGEIDCLTLHECGIYNSVSVPNGASSKSLEYLDNCWQYFEGMEKVVLAVDNDEAGKSLRNELSRRIGKEKCFTVEYPEGCKDANDVLIKFGKGAVVQTINEALVIPLEGITTMDEIFPIITDWYKNGYPKGSAARIPNFDELITFATGQVTTVTGIPGHGKDEFLNLVLANLAKFEQWIIGTCDFEETPAQTVTKLIEKFTGKSFDFREDPNNRIDIEEFEYGTGMVDKHFKFINTEEVETSIDGILEKAGQMVKRYGINALRINPWNWVESNREPFMSETEYVSLCYTKMITFARKFQIHIFLVAHTTKMSKGQNGKYEIPNLYSISGSANFYNKTHNGFTVYRDYETNNVDVYVQKVKQSWFGKIGFCNFSYNTYTRQYNSLFESNTNNRPVYKSPNLIHFAESSNNKMEEDAF